MFIVLEVPSKGTIAFTSLDVTMLNGEFESIGNIDKVVFGRLILCSILEFAFLKYFTSIFLLRSKNNTHVVTTQFKSNNACITCVRKEPIDFETTIYSDKNSYMKFDIEKLLRNHVMYNVVVDSKCSVNIFKIPLDDGGIGKDFFRFVSNSFLTPTVGGVGVAIQDRRIINATGYYIIANDNKFKEILESTVSKIYPSRNLFTVDDLLHKLQIPKDQTKTILEIKNIHISFTIS